jgi:glycosyltransferase involved in cell wall biosynthesis
MTMMLSACDAFVTTSDHARDLIRQFFPVTRQKPFEVVEHGRDFSAFSALGAFPDPGGRVRVLVPGNISASKGARILERMQALNADGRFEFHLMGDYVRELQGIPNLVLHGPYQRASFGDIARAILPHFGAVLSIWPETFCHTPTEMWASGLPVAAYDLGAVGDRIRRYGGGWLVEDIGADAMFAALRTIASDRAAFEARLAEVDLWQQGPGKEQSCAWMADAYDTIYRRFLSAPDLISAPVAPPAAISAGAAGRE